MPPSILASSTKLESAVEVSDNFAKVKSILNLWAPAAFSFDEPVALSSKDVSSVDVTNVSETVKPTRKLGFCAYFSNTKVCFVTSTKKPLM